MYACFLWLDPIMLVVNKTPVAIIYIPGLGDEQEPKGQIWAVKKWHHYGVESEVFRMRWGDGKPLQPKYERLISRIDELTAEGKSIGLIAASAGASVAVNAYADRQHTIAAIVLIAGKVNGPEKIHPLHYQKNPAMPASVKRAVSALDRLSQPQRRHILSVYGLTDGYVKRDDSYINGARNILVPTFGHFLNIAFQLTFGAPFLILFIKRHIKTNDSLK